MALYRFGPFQLDEDARSLLRQDKPVTLTGKVFDTLTVLVRNHGRVIEKEELLSAIWPNTVVEEANLIQNVSMLRKALGDNAKDFRFIATVAGRGYSFVAPVAKLARQDLGSAPPNGQGSGRETIETPPASSETAEEVSSHHRGRKSFSRPWFVAAFTLAGLAVGLGVWLKPWHLRMPPRINSLAVLPFENLSNDPEQEFFAQGMTEQLITLLSKIRTIRVISKTSAMKYRGKHKSMPEIARELGVEGIVSGSVTRLNGKVRITAQLIEGRADRYLWAESYSRNVSEVLEVQSEVAQAIVTQIRTTITSTERSQLAARRMADPEVNDLVLRGRYFADKYTSASLDKATGYFEQAIAKDPNYAPAHAGLAYVYWCRALANAPPREVMPKVKREAERALQLDETLAEAHVSLAYALLYYDWDWPQGEKHLKRALELNPSAADAHLVYGGYFSALGRPEEALAEARAAEVLDPLSLPVQQMILFALLGARQYDKVVDQFHRVVEREPNFPRGYLLASLAYTEMGQMDHAIEAIRKAIQLENGNTVQIVMAHVYAAKGDRAKAEQLLKEITAQSKRGYFCAYEVAHAYIKMGDKEKAYEWLEKGIRDRADCMIWLLVEPWMDPLRNDRRYRELIQYIGLATGKAGPKP
ncbi:MAG TPA: winged helix-turn-helix domain-containing protein [Bryobacteraceae bacterium]|jgi:TolB-like protein/DNA-binding winged helix-turn-helix (wHTH) protein